MNWSKICKNVRYDEPMSAHTSFRIGGPAEIFLLPDSRAELAEAIEAAPDALVMGNGSNLLISDKGLRGVVISTVGVSSLEKTGDAEILCECGVLLSRAASFAWKLGLSGLEFAAGIPGTVGGALHMNAGAYDGDMSRVTASSECLSSGRVEVITEHSFSYRESVYRQNPALTALSATFSLVPGDSAVIRAKMDDFAARRRERQPLEWPSAGSVFKRPPGKFAGTLIEQCGLKGFSVGGAAVSERHAGFIINTGGASCIDVLRLIEHVQNTVLRETGVSLEPEICVVGT